MQYVVYFILIAVALFFIHKFLKRFKFPKLTALSVFTGGVKVGKSAVSLACAISHYKRILRSWRFQCAFIRIINAFKRKNKLSLPEKPLFYSNIKLAGIEYSPLLPEHILRKVRFNFKSVVFVDEASLLADSQLVKIPELNIKLLIFFKLFGHETHGGYAIFNSQQLSDLHISLRRCVAQYFYIQSTSRYIPFFCVCKMREERYSEDGTVLNTYNEDLENTLRTVFFRKSVFRNYDYCCHSALTDNLPVKNFPLRLPKGSNLKSDNLVSFRPEFCFLYNNVGDLNNEKENI